MTLHDSGADIYNGYVAHRIAGGSVQGGLNGGSPIGLFYDFLSHEEVPTTQELSVYRAAKKIGYVTGTFETLADAAMFSGGSAPTVDAAIYGDAADGKLAITGTTKIGKVMGLHVQTRSASGNVNLWRCRFDITGVA
jgi:hypothetical protein